jgi:hypothetical protein
MRHVQAGAFKVQIHHLNPFCLAKKKRTPHALARDLSFLSIDDKLKLGLLSSLAVRSVWSYPP